MKYENVRWDEEVKNKTLNDMLDRKIAKRNDIIQHSRYALSNAQNKTLSYMLSLIAPNDPPEKMYRVYYRDIIKLLNWLDEHYTEHITIDQLSKLVGINERYLCSLFKKFTNKTPCKFIPAVLY